MLFRVAGGLIAAAASVVLGYLGFQAYLKWLVSGQTGREQAR